MKLFLCLFFVINCADKVWVDLEVVNNTNEKIKVELPLGVFKAGPSSFSPGSKAIHLGLKDEIPRKVEIKWKTEKGSFESLLEIPDPPKRERLLLKITINSDSEVAVGWEEKF